MCIRDSYWTDFHDLFTKWKVFAWIFLIRSTDVCVEKFAVAEYSTTCGDGSDVTPEVGGVAAAVVSHAGRAEERQRQRRRRQVSKGRIPRHRHRHLHRHSRFVDDVGVVECGLKHGCSLALVNERVCVYIVHLKNCDRRYGQKSMIGHTVTPKNWSRFAGRKPTSKN